MVGRNFVLVIAPDLGFRRSLEFALEVEGFAVSSHAHMSHAQGSPFATSAICSVVDDGAFLVGRSARQAVEWLAKPVILLGDRPRDFPASDAFTLLAKPLRGNELIETLQALVAAASTGYVFPLRT